MTFQIVPERPGDCARIEPLLDRTFGFDRHQRPSYRLREGVDPLRALSFVAVAEGEDEDEDENALVGSLRFWPVAIGAARTPAILLGPLAVEPALQGLGIGRALVRHGLAEARRHGHRICLVVGDPGYYEPFGFSNAGAAGLIMPGPVAPARFQVLELVPDALKGVGGPVRRVEPLGIAAEEQRHRRA